MSEEDTEKAIVEASNHPLSIIMVGVGDGPWDSVKTYDDGLEDRKFDNFQFVDFHQITDKAVRPEAAFAAHALMEIPDQIQYLKQAGLF